MCQYCSLFRPAWHASCAISAWRLQAESMPPCRNTIPYTTPALLQQSLLLAPARLWCCRYYLNGQDAYRLKLLLPLTPEMEQKIKQRQAMALDGASIHEGPQAVAAH